MTVVDDHVAGLAEPERAALQHLRELVHVELFETTKSSIHVSPDRMIPDELLLALMSDRLATIRAQG